MPHFLPASSDHCEQSGYTVPGVWRGYLHDKYHTSFSTARSFTVENCFRQTGDTEGTKTKQSTVLSVLFKLCGAECL